MKKEFLAAIYICFVPAFLNAETTVVELSHSELIKECVEGLGRGVDVEEFAAELLSRKRFHLGQENENNGKTCLEAAYGAEFVFEGGRFSSPDLEAVLARRAALAVAKRQVNELLYQQALNEACIAEYTLDRFRALTTPECGAFFVINGLPDGH